MVLSQSPHWKYNGLFLEWHYFVLPNLFYIHVDVPGQEANCSIAPRHRVEEVRVRCCRAFNHGTIGQHQLVAFANVLEQAVPRRKPFLEWKYDNQWLCQIWDYSPVATCLYASAHNKSSHSQVIQLWYNGDCPTQPGQIWLFIIYQKTFENLSRVSVSWPMVTRGSQRTVRLSGSILRMSTKLIWIIFNHFWA